MEETIGFDLRSIGPGPSWTVDRRTRYLLRRDVPAVRSVDPQVWERPPGLPPPPVPQGLWPSLSDLFAAAGEWHLFGDPDDAGEYAEVTEKRVPEHAPFYAHGIYQLR
ncbi:MAG: hypothetical protein ACRDOA_02255 [Streptosporangiaceae bacterium]